MSQTTMHDALPTAERVRKDLEYSSFSHGHRPLHQLVSVGVAQLRPEEPAGSVVARASAALTAAKEAGRNLCFWHDGNECHPVSTAFQAKDKKDEAPPLSLTALWRDSIDGGETQQGRPRTKGTVQAGPTLSGRSLFVANLTHRLAEWARDGAAVSVIVIHVDQFAELVSRFGADAQSFLRRVVGRLLEAATRDMDERCEFEDGLYAILLPGTDEANALAVADRLLSQVRQCKVRMGDDLWDLTASIGVAHCSDAPRSMDLMLSAEAAMKLAVGRGGDSVQIGGPAKEQPQGAGLV